MALEQQITEQQQEPARLEAGEEQDLSIAVNLVKNMIDDGGIEVIQQAEKSKDPGQVIGQFIFQLVSNLGEQLSGKIDFSPRIFFAHGGLVEQVSDYLQEQYDVPKDVMDRAEIYIATTAQSMAQQKQGQQQQPQQMTPMMPQGAA